MKAIEIPDVATQSAHCDYLVEKAQELKSLILYYDGLNANQKRAVAIIKNMMNSLAELKCVAEDE